MPRIIAQLSAPLHINVKHLVHALSHIPSIKYEGPDILFPTHETIVFPHKKSRPIFLEFSKKTPDGFYEITSDYTGEEIYYVLSMLKAEETLDLSHALIGTPLEGPNLDTDSFLIWTYTKRLLNHMTSTNLPSIHFIESLPHEDILSDYTLDVSDITPG
jgi:hypothetical protein